MDRKIPTIAEMRSAKKKIRKPKILFVGPLKDFSGYANAARNYVRSLDKVGCELVTRSVRYDSGSYKYSDREVALENKNLQGVEIILQQTTPNETERKEGVFNVNIFCWETDRIPREWVNQINQMDLTIVPCDENLIAARKSGVVIPIEKVPFAFDVEEYKKKPQPFFTPGTEDKFKLLTICQMTKKKGIDALLRAYYSEFQADESVILFLKVYISSNDNKQHKELIRNHIIKIKQLMRLDNYPKVMIIHEIMNDDGIKRLHSTADCYVLPSRGEGWSITHFDAMGYGLPPISTNWGGPTEFIDDDLGWLVDCHMSPCFDMPHPHAFMYTAKDNWAEPHIDSLQLAMRQAFTEWKMDKIDTENSLWSNRIRKCKDKVNQFSHDVVGPQLKEVIMKHFRRWKNGR